jgi:hypothetical protein
MPLIGIFIGVLTVKLRWELRCFEGVVEVLLVKVRRKSNSFEAQHCIHPGHIYWSKWITPWLCSQKQYSPSEITPTFNFVFNHQTLYLRSGRWWPTSLNHSIVRSQIKASMRQVRSTNRCQQARLTKVDTRRDHVLQGILVTTVARYGDGSSNPCGGRKYTPFQVQHCCSGVEPGEDRAGSWKHFIGRTYQGGRCHYSYLETPDASGTRDTSSTDGSTIVQVSLYIPSIHRTSNARKDTSEWKNHALRCRGIALIVGKVREVAHDSCASSTNANQHRETIEKGSEITNQEICRKGSVRLRAGWVYLGERGRGVWWKLVSWCWGALLQRRRWICTHDNTEIGVLGGGRCSIFH